MRRIVTGHREGKSVFMGDGEPPNVLRMEGFPDFEMAELWATEGVSLVPWGGVDPTQEMKSLVPEPGGTRFRVVSYPVDNGTGEIGAGSKRVGQEGLARMPGLAERLEAEDPAMHTTDTVDYGVVISGEIWLELDDGVQLHLKQGDCVVQNGTRHAWRNRGLGPCVMAFVMVGASRR